MSFEDLVAQVQKVPCQEIRARQAGYLEVVVSKAHWQELNTVLSAYFGGPLKPEGKEPSAEAQGYATPHGGVHEHQTLYYRKVENVSEMALLWPWGSGASLTAKIIQRA